MQIEELMSRARRLGQVAGNVHRRRLSPGQQAAIAASAQDSAQAKSSVRRRNARGVRCNVRGTGDWRES